MELARDLNAVLVALCSKSARAPEVAEIGRNVGTTSIAVDVGRSQNSFPAFETTRFLAGTVFASRSDLSIKRNLGLVLARAAGWERILFLDDDMWVPHAMHTEVAAGSLDCYRAVGLYNTGFPDHSVVCRVNREVGGEQEQFIGAGALVVSPADSRSFFPDIYREDWFYFLSEDEPLRLGMSGEVVQREYDPFGDPDRAQWEELGGSLAEGLYWLLDEGVGEQSVLDRADADFWADFLNRRRTFICDLLTFVRESDRGDRCAASLKQALDVNRHITPDLCVQYLNAWRADLQVWRRFVDEIDAAAIGSVEGALHRLGLADAAYLP